MPVNPATPEFALNYAMNRWGLNQKRNVGPTSATIRKCRPNSRKEWADYYYSNVHPREHIDSLGRRMYDELTNTVSKEERFHPDLLSSISEQDCIDYMHKVVIDRTFNGYAREVGLPTT